MKKIKIKRMNVVIEDLDKFFDKSKKEFKKLAEGKLKKSINTFIDVEKINQKQHQLQITKNITKN